MAVNAVCLPELRNMLSGSTIFRWCELSVWDVGKPLLGFFILCSY
jgi:hypothetical protein